MGMIGSMLGGAAISGIGSMIAGNQLSNGAKQAIGQANSTLQNQYNQVGQNQQGYMNAGNTAISTLSNDLQHGSGFASPFKMSDFYNDPGYQFTLQQGQNAINNSAAAKGGLLSGAAGKGLADYASGLANQTYGDAYNRYMQNRQQGFNELSGVAGLGQSAIQNTNGLQTNLAGQQSANTYNGLMGAANARAAGTMGMTNAAGGALSNLGQYYQMKSLTGGKL